MAPSLGNSTVWHAEDTGDGRLHLVSQKNNQAMNVEGASLANGARLLTWPRQISPASPLPQRSHPDPGRQLGDCGLERRRSAALEQRASARARRARPSAPIANASV